MPDRDWDKELAKIDKQLASLSDDALRGNAPVGQPPAPASAREQRGKPAAPVSSPAPRGEPYEQRPTRAWTVYLRLLLALAMGVGIWFWPYPAKCGLGLAGYLAATGVVAASGMWSAIWTWRHRAGRSHVLSLLVLTWGLILASIEVLPRVGYAVPTTLHPASWTCTGP